MLSRWALTNMSVGNWECVLLLWMVSELERGAFWYVFFLRVRPGPNVSTFLA